MSWEVDSGFVTVLAGRGMLALLCGLLRALIPQPLTYHLSTKDSFPLRVMWYITSITLDVSMMKFMFPYPIIAFALPTPHWDQPIHLPSLRYMYGR